MEAIVKGTVVVYEGYLFRTRINKTIKTIDVETGKTVWTKEKVIEDDRVNQMVIPLEDVYIGNIFEPDIQEQPYVIIRELLDKGTFKARYGGYKNIDSVPTELLQFDPKSGKFYFYDDWSTRIEDGQVEVLHYYNKWEDEYIIMANGEIITDYDNPIPFDHKQYPFAKSIFEPVGKFFYGKGLPLKIASLQDSINAMLNMALTRTYASLVPWYFTSIGADIDELDIRPMAVLQVPDPNNMREAQIASVSPGDNQVLETTRGMLDASSVDPSQAGQVSDQSATGILAAQEGAMRIMGLFANMLSWLIYDQAHLRTSNFLMFNTKPNKRVLKNGLVREEKTEFIKEDAILSDGSKGIQIVRIVDGEELPTVGEVQDEVEAMADRAEIFYVSYTTLRNLDFSLRIVPNSSVSETRTLNKAMLLEFVKESKNMFPNLVNDEGLYDSMIDVFKQNPAQVKLVQQQASPEMLQAQGQQMQGAPTNSPLVDQIANPTDSLQALTLNPNG